MTSFNFSNGRCNYMNKYETILSVFETRSISRTAALFNYTQSAVSQTIKNFERELGIELFSRSKNGMEPKPYTAEILDSLRIICREEKRISNIASSLAGLESGYVRIGAVQSISYYWLPDIMKAFSDRYPNIRFELSVDGFSPLRQLLKENRLDCIFVSEYSVPDMPFLPLGKDELMLVTPKDHPFVSSRSIQLTDLNNEDFILSADGLEYETGKLFQEHHIVPRIRYKLNDDLAVLKMVEKGFGITILPRLLVDHASFDIASLPLPDKYYRTLGMAFPPGILPDHAVQTFRMFAKKWTEQNNFI